MGGSGFQPQQFGKYLLTERIGAGGMAEIFRATAFGVEGFTKQVCIKRILPTLTSDETFIKMFIDEAKIAVNLHHANIVQVFDLGRIGEHYFIAMELVRGRDLLAIINRCRNRRRRLPPPLVVQIIAEVCRGLDYAHRCKVEGRPAGIIHRDVSPSNILVSWEGDVKVADFGIAKAAHKEQKTATGTLKGKYGYMSPEQVQGQPIDHRSDIFAAGVLLWESLAARRLFKGDTDLETLEMVRSARIPQLPSRINKAIPERLDAIASRALALRPQERYQTAAEMAEDLLETLYQMGGRPDSGRLAAFMKELFAAEIAEEERRERDRSSPELAVPPLPELAPTPSGPATRMDLPPSATPTPARSGMSPGALALLGSGLILLAGAVVVLVFWLANRPQPLPPQPAPAPAPSPQRPPGPPAPAPAVLFIESRPPGAAISVAGKPTGLSTPARLENLPRRRLRIGLELKGYRPWSQEVDLSQVGQAALSAELQRQPRPPPVRTTPGTVNVSTVPVWAWVYIDGKRLERPTPLYNLKLKPGRYRFRLVNPKLGLEAKRTVTVRSGKRLDLVIELEK